MTISVRLDGDEWDKKRKDASQASVGHKHAKWSSGGEATAKKVGPVRLLLFLLLL